MGFVLTALSLVILRSAIVPAAVCLLSGWTRSGEQESPVEGAGATHHAGRPGV